MERLNESLRVDRLPRPTYAAQEEEPASLDGPLIRAVAILCHSHDYQQLLSRPPGAADGNARESGASEPQGKSPAKHEKREDPRH